MVGIAGLEPARVLYPMDFKSMVSAFPPHPDYIIIINLIMEKANKNYVVFGQSMLKNHTQWLSSCSDSVKG